VVQNCNWEDNFQRLLVMSGPGTIRGCVFARMGSNISLNTGMGIVGGIPNDITIADNLFSDVSPRPHSAAIDVHAHNAQGKAGIPPIQRLTIRGNTFIRSGGPAMNLVGVTGSVIEDNLIESPVRATVTARPADASIRQAIVLRHSSGVNIQNNILSDLEGHTRPDAKSQSPILSLESTERISLDGMLLEDAPSGESEPKSRLGTPSRSAPPK
jgi:hypothetical protein